MQNAACITTTNIQYISRFTIGGKRRMQFAIFFNHQHIAFTHPIFIGCIIDILMPIKFQFFSISQTRRCITKRNILRLSRFSRHRLCRQYIKACTGHHTRSNQHCQQLFGRAAFAASILRDFRNNNVSIASFVPNDFKYLVHATFLQNAFLIFIYLRGPNPRKEVYFIMQQYIFINK